jgi:hypothetical protein
MTSGLTLINEWGGGGYVSGGASFTTMAGYYWSSDFDYINAMFLEYTNYVGGYLIFGWTWMYDYGYQVRCVR